MPKEKPTSIRFSSAAVKAAIEAFSRAGNRSASNTIEELVVEGLKKRNYLTPSGRLGKAAMRDDSDE